MVCASVAAAHSSGAVFTEHLRLARLHLLPDGSGDYRSLPAFVKAKHTPVVIVFGLLDTFYDEQAPLFEVQASIGRIVAALQQLKRDRVSVLLASTDAGPIPPARRGLLPGVMKVMDRVYQNALPYSQTSIHHTQLTPLLRG